MENNDRKICALQDEMLDMGVGYTKIISGRVVTKWAKDSFEIDTFGRNNQMCSEHIAEEILKT